jgi:hypothetical protein
MMEKFLAYVVLYFAAIGTNMLAFGIASSWGWGVPALGYGIMFKLSLLSAALLYGPVLIAVAIVALFIVMGSK